MQEINITVVFYTLKEQRKSKWYTYEYHQINPVSGVDEDQPNSVANVVNAVKTGLRPNVRRKFGATITIIIRTRMVF